MIRAAVFQDLTKGVYVLRDEDTFCSDPKEAYNKVHDSFKQSLHRYFIVAPCSVGAMSFSGELAFQTNLSN